MRPPRTIALPGGAATLAGDAVPTLDERLGGVLPDAGLGLGRVSARR